MTALDFFIKYFPYAYVCAMADSGGQFEGAILDLAPESETLDRLGAFVMKYQELNKSRNNIFFTPNGASTVEGRNSLSNLKKTTYKDTQYKLTNGVAITGEKEVMIERPHINAWWIDIDIDATKICDDDETKILRERKKSEIAGIILCSDLVPSLTVETRNGYQLYWFTNGDATLENFLGIGHGVYEFYKSCGADKSTIKVMQLMRVPNFYYFKHGEMGKIIVRPELSTFERVSEATMLKHFPVPEFFDAEPKTTASVKVYKPVYKKVIGNDPNDIFIKVVNMRIDEVLNKLSGHWLVNGDVITTKKFDTDRSNVLFNNKISPVFVVRSRNHIYSNNADEKGPTIIQFLRWYWPGQDYKIAEGLKQLFTSSL